VLYTASGCYSIGENISLGSGNKGDVRYTMSGWLHSDGHRESLLNPGFRHVGFGVVRGEYEAILDGALRRSLLTTYVAGLHCSG